MNGIPVLEARGDSIARAWENSLVALYREGCDIKTQYDKPDDPPSKDATMLLVVDDPLAEPMIHRDFPGGFEELQEYVMEVCDGIKDHWVRDSNDAYKAAFMNIFALVQLQRRIAERIEELAGVAVRLGRYCHLADSYHIYGSNLQEFEGRFLNALEKRTFEGRTMRYADVRDMMEEARPAILEKAQRMGANAGRTSS